MNQARRGKLKPGRRVKIVVGQHSGQVAVIDRKSQTQIYAWWLKLDSGELYWVPTEFLEPSEAKP